jgi:hypothetical protein
LGLDAALSNCAVAKWVSKAVQSGVDPYSYLNMARQKGLDVGDSNLAAAERYFEGYNGNYNTVELIGDTFLKWSRVIPGVTRIVGKNGAPASAAFFINYFGVAGNLDADLNQMPGASPLGELNHCNLCKN